MQRDYWPTAAWRSTEPASLGIKPEGFISKLEEVIRTEYSNINGIVIVRNGYIAYERYFNGYNMENVHHVASATKSVLSALMGIAIDQGFIESVDQKVLDFFPEYDDKKDELKQTITICHLLTMTVPYAFEDWKEPLDKLSMSPDWVKFALDMLGQNGKIGPFKYSTAGAHLLSAIITRSTGKCAREFANEYLFGPIGMQEIPDHKIETFGFEELFGKKMKGWVHDPQGNSTGGWGLQLTPRDMARFGYLYLNHGLWDGSQVVSEQWVKDSIKMNPNHYGYLWWLGEETGVSMFSAIGDGGNVICCVPDKDLVVAIASEFMINPKDRGALIKEYILPAINDSLSE